MKRCILVFLLAVVLSFPLTANLVENNPVEVTQPDGTKLSLFVSGDEYYHRVHDEKGFTILKNSLTGYAVYAIPDGNSIQASDYAAGTVDPSTLGLQPNLMLRDPETENYIREQESLRHNSRTNFTTGTVNHVVVFIRFADQTSFPATPSFSAYDNMFNSNSQQSLKDFYQTMSNNQLTLNSLLRPAAYANGTVASYQATHNRNYYSPYNAVTNPAGYANWPERTARHNALITEICTYLDPLIANDINLDVNGDTELDAITIVIRGASDAWGNLLWPSSNGSGNNIGQINGAWVHSWILCFEGVDSPSVFCHEMGHRLGALDYYHYYDSAMGNHAPWNTITPVHQWDLMCIDNTQSWLTYTKWKYGHWFTTIPTITPMSTPTTYTLTAIDSSPFSCYKIASTNPNQFYMLEYRKKTGRYDIGVPGSGLIVYRIISSYNSTVINGNASGPPDEVYVYRPGGTLTVNGAPHTAAMSEESGFTSIFNGTNPSPWLYVDTLSVAIGNLVITDVGSISENTLTFTVQTEVPNLWLGTSGTSWSTNSNWSKGHAPTSSEAVIIASPASSYPTVSSTAVCNSLKMGTGTTLNINTGTLTVSGDIHIGGEFIMSNSNARLTVNGNFYWDSGASVNVVMVNPRIDCYGDMQFSSGSNVAFNIWGTIYFLGSAASNIRVYAETTLCSVVNNKTGALSYSALSTHDLRINSSLNLMAGSTFYGYASHTLFIQRDYTCAATAVAQLYSGTVCFYGTINSQISDSNPANYFSSLTISKTGTYYAYLSQSITVKGHFSLLTGYFQPGNYVLSVGGDWNNLSSANQGQSGFTPGTSTVSFNGSANQNCYGLSSFHIVQLNKPSGELVLTSSAQISCASYDWVAGAYRVEGGSFTAADMADDGIYGTIILNSGSITYTQDTANYVDLRAVLTIHNGTFTVNGGNGPVYFSYLTPATLNMDGGILDFKDVGILVYGGASFTDNITGGTIKTRLDFSCQRTDYNPTGGTLEMYGPGSYGINIQTGSRLFNLKINKTATRQNEIILTKDLPRIQTLPSDHVSESANYRINDITASTNIYLDGSLYVQAGNFNVNGRNIETAYDIHIAANLTMTSTANLYCGRDFYWDSGSTTNVTTGNFFCWGSWLFNSGSAAHLTGSTTNLKSNYIGSIISSSSNSWFGSLNIYGTDEQGCYYQIETASTNDLAITGSLQVYPDNVLNLNFNRNLLVNYDVTIFANGCINAAYGTGTTLTVGRNWTDNNTTYSTLVGFNPGTSTVVFNGGTASTLTLGPTVYAFYNLTINKTAGIAVNFPKSVQVLGNCNLTSGIWNDTAASLTESFYGNFSIGANGVWSTSNRNTIAFYGSANQGFTNSGSSYFYNLSLAKTAGTVTLGSNLICLNAGTININNGTLDLNHYYFRTTGEIAVGNTGVLSIDADAWLEVADTKTLNVNSGGLLEVLGEGSSHPAKITHQSGLYFCHINSGGTISAEYAVFEYMGTGGVFVYSGALVSDVHSFHHCTFQYGIAGGALLVINNAQTMTINEPVFPANVWEGAYNVRKPLDQGTVNIYNASGAFAGEGFDGDTYNRINWLGGLPDLVVSGYSLNNSNPVVGTSIYYSVTVTNNSNTDCNTAFQIGLYVNSATQPGVGSTPNYTRSVTSLPAHASVTRDFSAVTNNVPAIWTSWFLVDYTGAVSEAAEGNNIWGPRTVTWQTLPPIVAPTITKIAATNNVRLDWTYPYTVTRYKVYRSSNPYSGFTQIATPTVRYYEEAASALKYFYRVTAELNP